MLSEYLMLDRLSVEQTWLKDFFALQTSLLVPLEFTRNIPQHIYIDSPLVSFRMLCLPWVKEICEEQSCPITSTSLNRSGQDPILTHEQAKDFHMSWAPDAKLVEGQGNLSGQSSTMLKYNGNGTFEVVRAGAKVDEIKNHLALLSA
jgi:L-threonylcarbamoyladenylate synthase